MVEQNYLQWLSKETATNWWHDSADLAELRAAMKNGAVGVTTNPLLVATSLHCGGQQWSSVLQDLPRDLGPDQRAEELMKVVTQSIAQKLQPEHP